MAKINKPRKRGSKVFTRGEQLLIEYLDRFSIKHERWQRGEGKQPDRVIHAPIGKIICENKDIEWGAMEDEIVDVTLSHGGVYADAGAPPLAKSQKRIQDALDKLAALESDQFFVPVLHNKTLLPHTNGPVIQQALYGPTAIKQWVGAEGALSDAWLAPLEDLHSQSDYREGFFGRTLSIPVSAVGIIWEHKPNEEAWHDFSYSTFCEVLARKDRTDQMLMDAINAKQEEFEATQGPKDLIVPCLAVYHNPFAGEPLPKEAFSFDPGCYQMWFDRTVNRFVHRGSEPASW